MFNIKNKTIIRKIFLIIIFIYNRKFILNASEKHNNQVPERIYNNFENTQDELIAEKLTNTGKMHVINNMLEKAAEAFQEAAELYNKLALYYKKKAEESKTSRRGITREISMGRSSKKSI